MTGPLTIYLIILAIFSVSHLSPLTTIPWTVPFY